MIQSFEAKTAVDRPHLNYLDGWRGLAIAFLLVGHFFPVRGIDFGQIGVNLFFVLSGLLMAGLLFIQKTPINVFYKRRISRIIPALFFFLLALLPLSAVTGQIVVWPEWIAAALLINNYLTDLGHITMPVGHVWSLSVEEHSYIALSLVAILGRSDYISPQWLISILCGASILTGTWYFLNPTAGNWNHSEVAAFGLFLSAFFRILFDKTGIKQFPVYFYPIFLLLGLALQWWSVPKPIQAFVGIGFLALIVNILFKAPKSIQTILSFSPLRQMGIWSFSIYLWQQPFFFLVQRKGVMEPWVGLVLSVMIGFIGYHLIELPARRFLNRVWAK